MTIRASAEGYEFAPTSHQAFVLQMNCETTSNPISPVPPLTDLGMTIETECARNWRRSSMSMPATF